MRKRAVVLLSGGLDSTLAAKLMLEQGVGLLGVNFDIGFGGAIKQGKGTRIEDAAARDLGIKLMIKDVSDEFLEVLRHPKFGYGSGRNPCVDCKVFMLKKAKGFMQEAGASFIVTGEVLGQRPMSQRRDALAIIERESGLEGFLLRPLSAKLLDPTEPEKQGIVDREKLLAIQGRSRKPQFELAERFGIREYPNPAGGCLLTDPAFSKRVGDLLGRGEATADNVALLKVGRHFRLSDACKLVVGRNEEENDIISGLAKKDDILMNAGNVPAPVGLLKGKINKGDIELGLRIVARYADKGGIREDKGKSVDVGADPCVRPVAMEYWKTGSTKKTIVEVEPLNEKKELEKIRI